MGKPVGRAMSPLRLVQFRPHPPILAGYSGNGGGDCGSRLDDKGATYTMNNGKPNPLDGLDECLAGIYETLKLQVEKLHEMSVDTAALVHVLRASPQLSKGFDEERKRLLAELSEKHAERLRLLDETIRRL